MIEAVSIGVLCFLAGFSAPYVLNWADWYLRKVRRERPWFDS